jgi:hypothetical protein
MDSSKSGPEPRGAIRRMDAIYCGGSQRLTRARKKAQQWFSCYRQEPIHNDGTVSSNLSPQFAFCAGVSGSTAHATAHATPHHSRVPLRYFGPLDCVVPLWYHSALGEPNEEDTEKGKSGANEFAVAS